MEENRFDRQQPAISVKNVSKSFRIFRDKGSQLKELLLFWNRRKYEKREVLKDISFDVARGEAVGLIGHNGCGKSTTLKLLTRIMYPDSGSITIDGRVSALIELGAGFHPDMSGRENIYINAAIFGLSRREVEERLDEIIAFSELEEYIDSPVRTYSSGMYMRLAFSVAINVDADILFVDEILAVGDASFQEKCIAKLQQIKAAGTTIVIVSHDLGQIENLCDRSIWINDGRITMQGQPQKVHAAYLAYMHEANPFSVPPPPPGKAFTPEVPLEDGERIASLRGVTVLDKNKRPCSSFQRGDEILIKVDYFARKPLEEPICGIGFFRSDKFYIYGTNTLLDGVSTGERLGEQYYIFRITANPFMPGTYSVDAALSRRMGEDYERIMDAVSFTITEAEKDEGNVFLQHTWELS